MRSRSRARCAVGVRAGSSPLATARHQDQRRSAGREGDPGVVPVLLDLAEAGGAQEPDQFTAAQRHQGPRRDVLPRRRLQARSLKRTRSGSARRSYSLWNATRPPSGSARSITGNVALPCARTLSKFTVWTTRRPAPARTLAIRRTASPMASRPDRCGSVLPRHRTRSWLLTDRRQRLHPGLDEGRDRRRRQLRRRNSRNIAASGSRPRRARHGPRTTPRASPVPHPTSSTDSTGPAATRCPKKSPCRSFSGKSCE